jgi:hypothetical protein
MQLRWVERALHAFVHRAWFETYSPTWSPNGPWKWFWKLSNYEPPIPFMTMMKYVCQFTFFVSLVVDYYTGVASITLYWFMFSKTRAGKYVGYWHHLESCVMVLLPKVAAGSPTGTRTPWIVHKECSTQLFVKVVVPKSIVGGCQPVHKWLAVSLIFPTRH